MRWVIRYRHPVTGNRYYFKKLRQNGDQIKAVGVFPCYVDNATVFDCIKAAAPVYSLLVSLGYKAFIVKFRPRVE